MNKKKEKKNKNEKKKYEKKRKMQPKVLLQIIKKREQFQKGASRIRNHF
jgi:hypothetical protein